MCCAVVGHTFAVIKSRVWAAGRCPPGPATAGSRSWGGRGQGWVTAEKLLYLDSLRVLGALGRGQTDLPTILLMGSPTQNTKKVKILGFKILISPCAEMDKNAFIISN